MLPLSEKTTPKPVASWFVNNIDREAGEAITHLKLQKLVYYAEAWYLAFCDKPLFEEAPQAWTHGPVYPSLFQKYRENSWDSLPIERHARRVPDDLAGFLQSVFNSYGQFGAKRLEELTHEETPWKETRGNLPLEARCTTPMNKLTIRNYYAEKIGKEEIQNLSR